MAISPAGQMESFGIHDKRKKGGKGIIGLVWKDKVEEGKLSDKLGIKTVIRAVHSGTGSGPQGTKNGQKEVYYEKNIMYAVPDRVVAQLGYHGFRG